MSAQEAAATAVPVVSSDLVPFAREYLLGPSPAAVRLDEGTGAELLVGAGAVVVPADDVAAKAGEIAARMAALKVGDGTDPSVDVGPLVNAATRDKVAAFVADAELAAARDGGNLDVTEVPVWFLPELALARDELRAGRAPSWNPHARAGAPLHAHGLIGLCYPPN